MGLVEIDLSGGLRTDAPGGLLEAQDVVYSKDGELRKRGGKGDLGANASAPSGYIYAPVGFLPLECIPSTATYSHYLTTSPRCGGAYAGGTITWTNLNSAGGGYDGNGTATSGPAGTGSLFRHGNELIAIGAIGGSAARWNGSKYSPAYTTGTVAMSTGSATVTGSGTTWTTSMAGMYLSVLDADVGQYSFRVKSVESATSLTLEVSPVFANTVSGATYRLSAFGVLNSGLVSGRNYVSSYSGVGCSHQGRVFVSDPGTNTVVNYETHRVRWSGTAADSDGTYKFAHNHWDSAAYLDVAPGLGGRTTGMVSYQNTLVVLRERAVIAVRGAFATDGTDIGASVDVLSDNLGHYCTVYEANRVAVTPMGVVFADRNGLHATDGGTIRTLSDPIARWWRDNASASYRVFYTGRMIVVSFGDINAAAGSATLLTFDTHTGAFATQANVAHTAIVIDHENVGVIAGFTATDDNPQNWEADWSDTNKNDPSGSGPRLKITTKPVPLNPESPGTGTGRVTAVRVNGVLADAAADNPTLGVKLLYGRKGLEAGSEAAVTLTDAFVEGTVDGPVRIPVDVAASPAKNAVRLQLHQTAAASYGYLYGVALDVTQSNVVNGV